MAEHPTDPIAAVAHPMPYGYYAALVRERPLYRDQALGLWVASSAAAVSAVLGHDLCRVRPPREPVPAAIAGGPAGAVFRHLVRMTDGTTHGSLRRAVVAALGALDDGRVREQAERAAAALLAHRPGLSAFSFDLSAQVIGRLLGLAEAELPQIAAWTGDFVHALSPLSGPREIAAAQVAAAALLERLQRVALPFDGAAGARAANLVGFLSQAYEATAGLIGNTLLALARDPALLAAPRRVVLREVLRHDSPVQNTRRFLAGDGTVAGQAMREGDAILVVLAAANRDPAVHGEPDRCDPLRPAGPLFSFGAGNHACPGETLALTIAEAGIDALLRSGFDLRRLPLAPAYRRSVNTRIPLWR